jgi:DmsE family decaheme c-type cytochrome
MLKSGNWISEACTGCHTEKRGPFLWEHGPVRQNCTTCHDPHGSNNDRLLVAKLPMLCQRCHVASRHPATIYDGTQLATKSNRLIGRGCVNCHSQIHGSNSPSGNRFLR